MLPTGLALHLVGGIPLEQLVLFVALGAGMLQPLLKLLFLFGSLQKVQGALARIRDVLSAVNDVSFNIEPGSMTAVIGASGAGKTTLAKLLVRSFDVDAGSITIGQQDLRVRRGPTGGLRDPHRRPRGPAVGGGANGLRSPGPY